MLLGESKDWAFEECSESEMRKLNRVGASRAIERLMDATFAAQDQGLKVLLATMERRARKCEQEIEGRLGVRN
jgi:hypothetical protein